MRKRVSTWRSSGGNLVQAPFEACQRAVLGHRERWLARIVGSRAVGSCQRHDLAVVRFVLADVAEPAQARMEASARRPSMRPRRSALSMKLRNSFRSIPGTFAVSPFRDLV